MRRTRCHSSLSYSLQLSIYLCSMLYCIHLSLSHTLPIPPLPPLHSIPLHSSLLHSTPLLSSPPHPTTTFHSTPFQSQLLLSPTILYTLFSSIPHFSSPLSFTLIHNILFSSPLSFTMLYSIPLYYIIFSFIIFHPTLLFSSPLSFTLFYSLTLLFSSYLHQPTKRTTINAMQCYLNGGDYRSVMSVFEQIPKVS